MYNVAILGGGPAGYTAAERAIEGGLNVVLFEKKNLGGTCLNEGCIPTKCLLYSAKQYHNAVDAMKYGVKVEGVSFDYVRMQQRKQKVVRKLVAGVKAKVTAEGSAVVNGEARVVSCEEGRVVIACGEQTYEAEHLIVCTGSDNFVPPIKGVDLPHVWDSTAALAATALPERLAIVGGGVIGMEFASLFNTLGVKVTVIEMLPKILGNMDDEISTLLRDTLAKAGVDFKLQARVTKIKPEGVCYELDGQELLAEADNVLVSVGRRPNLRGLEALSFEMQGRGLKVDAHMQTSLKGVYAAGDVTGFSMLAHTAVREAEVAVNHLLGRADEMHYNAVPGVVYTNPEVAGVGETEASLTQKGADFGVARLPMSYSGRFVAENEGVNGLCKVLYMKDDHRVVGVHMLGNYSSEIINQAAQAIDLGLTAERWERCVVAHPTVSEILKETLATI